MDELIQKYMDGDLSDEEASAFTRALAEEPALEAELRAFEQSLSLAAACADRDPSPGFTDQVMERVTASAAGRRALSWRTRRGPGTARAWWPRLAWAAGFSFVFALGFVVARQVGQGPMALDSPTAVESGGAGGEPSDVAAAQTAARAQMRLVRLVYVPPDEDVEKVTVAGTFNGWDPERTELRRVGGAWMVQLVLPPQTYEYMFVEDGEKWVTDPLAVQTRDDGFGRENAVLDLTL